MAVVAVSLLTVVAWRSSDLRASEIRWSSIMVMLAVAAPLSLGLRALEFDASARILGRRYSAGRSLRVAVTASVANLFPLPGSLMVNVRALSGDGVSFVGAVGASTVPGVAWLGLVGLVGGVAMVMSDAALAGWIVVLGGAFALGAAMWLFARTVSTGKRWSLGVRILAVEVGFVLVSVLRLSLALSAIHESATLAQVLALSVAGALTTAVGFFPAGLGIRELLVAGIAPMVGLPFSSGALVGVLDRVVWLAFLALAMSALAAGRGKVSERDR